MSIGSAIGYCETHKIEKMMMGTADHNLTPACVRCEADLKPKQGRTQMVDDPGESFFGGQASDAKVTIVKNAPTVAISAQTLEEVVASAVVALNKLPMPKDVKQFKAVQKAIKVLESLVEKNNG